MNLHSVLYIDDVVSLYVRILLKDLHDFSYDILFHASKFLVFHEMERRKFQICFFRMK